jgi:hypothetical protein
MSFWDLSDGGNAADTGTDFEIPGGGNMDPIPDGSSVLAMIDEAKWSKKDEAEFISLRWTVLSPDEYKNRKVFQKLWVTDDDPSAKDADKAATKRDKARRMLAAIDANAGGKMSQKPGTPTDETLTACLSNKPMIIKCMVWEMPDRESPGAFISGNWISAVSPKAKGIDVKDAAPKKVAAQRVGNSDLGDDEEIPF